MRHVGLGLWFCVLVLALFVLAIRLPVNGVQSDMLALLPKAVAEQEWELRARTQIERDFSDQVLVLVSHEEEAAARQAAQTLIRTLSREELIVEPVQDTNQDTLKPELFFKYRMGLLSDQNRSSLLSGNAETVQNEALALIYSPLSVATTELIENDPYLLLPQFLSALQSENLDRDQTSGLPVVYRNEQFHFLVNAELTGPPMSPRYQQKFVPAFTLMAERLQIDTPDLSIRKFGAIFYAERATQSAKQEVSIFGVLSLLGIVMLTLLIFRNLQPLMLALLAMTSGVLSGLAAVLFWFGSVHLITLAFGAALLGISVDYAFHYCCERFSKKHTTGQERLAAIYNGLTLGMVSSVVGFSTLAFTPLPGLQQISVFTVAGLLMSYFSVVVLFPRLDRAAPLHEPRLLRHMNRAVSKPHVAKVKQLAFVAIVALAGYGAFQFQVDDDIRRLQNLPEDLQLEEKALKTASGLNNSAQYFLIRGDDIQSTLEAEETLRNDLDALVSRNMLSGYTAISRYVPSIRRQSENRKLVEDHLLGAALDSYRLQLGHFTASWNYPQNETGYLTPDQLKAVQGFDQIALLQLISSPQEVIHLVTLNGVSDLSVLQDAANQIEGARFIDPTGEITQTLSTYRSRALIFLVAASVLIFAGLSVRYGPWRAFKVVLVPLAAVGLTPVLLAVTGAVFTFFNAIALILVFALGLDYALFCSESDDDGQHISQFANGLSAISSILAFGMLAFSQQYALHAIGATVSIGLVLAFFSAPMCRK